MMPKYRVVQEAKKLFDESIMKDCFLKIWLDSAITGEISIVSCRINNKLDIQNALLAVPREDEKVVSMQLVYRPNEVK